jgi:transcriptional regulator with XRE-family HTH domain
MDIYAFVKAEGLSMGAFAERAGLSQPSLSRLAKGTRYGTLEQHARLYKASNGAVTPTDLMLASAEFQALRRLRSGIIRGASRPKGAPRKPAKRAATP